jgi:RNA polymerase sigma-70 factor (ECF subfamily)
VYAFIRGRGEAAADAEDLTQAYFTRFLEKDCLRDVRPEHGRFRSFLLVSVRNFVLNERERERARKRGGLAPSLDAAAGEPATPSSRATPRPGDAVREKLGAHGAGQALDRLRGGPARRR